MNKLKNYTLIILLILITSSLCNSGSNNLKTDYQGYLSINGQQVSGTKGFKFRIKNDSVGAIQWESACTNVVVSTGLFRATLGLNNFTGNWDTINWLGIDAYLEVEVGDADTCGNSAILSSNEQMLAVPYSMFAATAGVITNVISSSTLVSDSSGLSKVTGGLMSVSGNDVGISSSSPVSKLAVEGGTVTAFGFVVSGNGKFDGAGAFPPGAVIFYNGTSCPSGWAEFIAARGMYIVGLNTGGLLGGTSGQPLTDQENRTAGLHTHQTVTVTDTGHTHPYSHNTCFNGNSSGCNQNRTQITGGNSSSNTTGISLAVQNPAGSVAGTPAPYIQYLVCEKQ